MKLNKKMKPKKKILFAMEEVGGGHKSPALAIKESVEELYPGKYELKVMDIIKEVGCSELDKKEKDRWDFLLKHPLLCKNGLYTLEFFQCPVKWYMKIRLTPFYPKLAAFMQEYKPDVIISTHFYPSFAIDYVRRKYHIKTKVVSFDSDPFNVHLFWAIKGPDWYIVCSDTAKKEMIRRGVPAKQVVVFPYPLKNSFFHIKKTANQVKKELGIDLKKKTLLITTGSQGIGWFNHFIDKMIKANLSLNVIVVAGKNEKLQEQLTKKYGDHRKNIGFTFLGFRTDMNEIITASDFVFIKPGAATTFECISMKKPVIFYMPAAPNESGNITFVEKNGMGLYCGRDPKKFLKYVKMFLTDSIYQQYLDNFGKIKIKNGSDDIARFLAKLADSSR
jgi:UDP-N-acetylglucosamine:LPS N-acetylglucosamine transferase